MQVAYSAAEAGELHYNFHILREGLREVHPRLAHELERACDQVTREIGNRNYAQVLVASELLGGINRDERPPRPLHGELVSAELQAGLRLARSIGRAVAPFALRDMRKLLRSYFNGSPPRLGQRAKEAILRCQMIHSTAQQRAGLSSRTAGTEVAWGSRQACR